MGRLDGAYVEPYNAGVQQFCQLPSGVKRSHPASPAHKPAQAELCVFPTYSLPQSCCMQQLSCHDGSWCWVDWHWNDQARLTHVLCHNAVASATAKIRPECALFRQLSIDDLMRNQSPSALAQPLVLPPMIVPSQCHIQFLSGVGQPIMKAASALLCQLRVQSSTDTVVKLLRTNAYIVVVMA